MTTLTTRFPMRVAFGFTGGARYNTGISINLGGDEQANQNWTQSRGRWVATQQAKREEPTQTLVKLFHAAAGRKNYFPFRDWTDYRVASSEGVLLALGGGLYQLQKRYTFGGVNRDRDIYLPVSATVAGGGTYAVNTSTGVVTHSAGNAPTGWSGQFDCLCRFDSDDLNVTTIGANQEHGVLYTWGGIEIVEVRPIA